MAPYAALLEEWHKDGSNAVQLGLEPERDDLPKSLWFVHGHGGSVKLAKFLQGNVAGLTPDSLQKMWHDRFEDKLCLEDYLFTVDGDMQLGLLPDPAGDYAVSDDEGHMAPPCEDMVPLVWYTDLLDSVMEGRVNASGMEYTRQEVACLKYMRRVFCPTQACSGVFCVFTDGITGTGSAPPTSGSRGISSSAGGW